MEDPMDPRAIQGSRMRKEGAIPDKGINTIGSKTPPNTNPRVWYRSVILEYPSYKFIPYHMGISVVEKTIKNGRVVFDKTRNETGDDTDLHKGKVKFLHKEGKQRGCE